MHEHNENGYLRWLHEKAAAGLVGAEIAEQWLQHALDEARDATDENERRHAEAIAGHAFSVALAFRTEDRLTGQLDDLADMADRQLGLMRDLVARVERLEAACPGLEGEGT